MLKLWKNIDKQKSVEKAYKQQVQLWSFALALDLFVAYNNIGTGGRYRTKIYRRTLKSLFELCYKTETILIARFLLKLLTNWETKQTNMDYVI